MRILVIIPVYNYYDILFKVVQFYNNSLDEADVLIINDGDIHEGEVGYDLRQKLHFKYTQNDRLFHGDLRYIYSNYYNPDDYDCIIINEHDVMPNETALYACLEAFQKYEDEMIASVSCMYEWQNKLCYPANISWEQEQHFENNHLGKLVKVGRQGVPFAFSLWKPKALVNVNNPVLPKLWKLDSQFGIFLNSVGYYHLRLQSHYVEHMNGGIMSWK